MIATPCLGVSVFVCSSPMLPYVFRIYAYLAETAASRVPPQERHEFDRTTITSHTFRNVRSEHMCSSCSLQPLGDYEPQRSWSVPAAR